MIKRGVARSLNRPQRERLPCFKSGISVVKKIKLTVVTCASKRFFRILTSGETQAPRRWLAANAARESPRSSIQTTFRMGRTSPVSTGTGLSQQVDELSRDRGG